MWELTFLCNPNKYGSCAKVQDGKPCIFEFRPDKSPTSTCGPKQIVVSNQYNCPS
jgi:hypothetical protein